VVAELAFIDGVMAGAASVFQLSESHLPRVRELMAKYADLPMDLADASLVVLAEELGTGRIFTTDRRDFGAYRWKNRKPFHNLLRLPA
jgi:predicted nucleic acid-binding protein